MTGSGVSATEYRGIRPLDRAFFERSTRLVARGLLGKVLVREAEQGGGGSQAILAGRIVEVEAYLGANDLAAHSAVGRTKRNSVLFGPPGYAYVYFIYGNHYCLNVSCEPDGQAGGVLFRALEPLIGIEQMARARGVSLEGISVSRSRKGIENDKGSPTRAELRLLTSGPGRLSEAFSVTRDRDNGRDLTIPGGLWIGDDGYRPRNVEVTRRIGISKASEKPLRYLLPGNAFVSGSKSFFRRNPASQV